MKPADDLISRFVEDPGAATPEELDALIEALHEEPAMAVRLREQLILDDLLAQKLAVDRRYFMAQVEQRIADYERGQDEIDGQVSDLRAIAETEIERPGRRGRSLWMNLLMVAAAVALIAGVFIAPSFLAQGRAVARVEAIEGEAQTTLGQNVHPLAVGDVLKTDQHVNVAEGSSVAIVYADKTRVELASGTNLIVGGDPRTGAKSLTVAQGEVFADVAKQVAGPMLFNTPHAVATVLGTQLRITVDNQATRLDVTEGLVEFARKDGSDSVRVAANETGEVRDDVLRPTRLLEWPDQRDSVVFLFEGSDRLTLSRNPATGNFWDTSLEGISGANLGANRHLQLSGGQFSTEEGGSEVTQLCQRASQFSLEAIVTPERARMRGSIIALAFANGQGNFELAQENDQLVFRLQTEGTMQKSESIELGKLTADSQSHVSVTYRGGVLCGYIDGKEVARREDVHGGLGNWKPGPLAIGGDSAGARRWRGQVAGIAMHNRALDADEVVRNVRNFRSMHAVAAREPRWISLMAEGGPEKYSVAGNWTAAEYSWQSEGSGERLSLRLVENGSALKSYDVRAELHVVQSGGEPIELLLPVGSQHVAAVLQPSGASSTVNGLDLIDLRPASDNSSGLADRQLELQRIYTIECQVRVKGEQATVVVFVDGEPWTQWSGPRERLSLRTERKDWAESSPVLSVGKNRVQVHSLKVRNHP